MSVALHMTSSDHWLTSLQELDQVCIDLQREGKYLEALECMEKGLILRQQYYGPESDEVWETCKTVGELCNLLAMTYLQQEDYNMVSELLKKAEILTERDPISRAATYNNYACFYRRKGKLHSALQYLQKVRMFYLYSCNLRLSNNSFQALNIESKLQNVPNPADTHINACAVLSQLGRHQQALGHAQSALILLQEELLPSSDRTPLEERPPPSADRIAVLAIAYHNTGVEQEFLKNYDQCILSYRKGVEVSERYLGAAHAITGTLKSSLSAAKKASKNGQSKLKSRAHHQFAAEGNQDINPSFKTGKNKKSTSPTVLASISASITASIPRPDSKGSDLQQSFSNADNATTSISLQHNET